jgi:hypothetical protein
VFQNITILIIAIFCCASINANTLNDIEEYLKLPSKDIDPIHGLLLVDKIILPNTDIKYYRNRITEIIEEIKAIYGSAELHHIINHLFNKSEENNYSVLEYPSGFVLGKEPTIFDSKYHTLSHIIETKKGACSSRAFLFYAVCNEAKIDAMLGYAPYHPFVMFKSAEDGKLLYTETGGNAYFVNRNYFLKRWGLVGYSNKSLFLVPLYNKEIVLIALTNAVSHFMKKNDLNRSFYLNDLILQYKPFDFAALKNARYIIYKKMIAEEKKDDCDWQYISYLDERLKKIDKVISSNNLYDKDMIEFLEVSRKYDKEINPYITVN